MRKYLILGLMILILSAGLALAARVEMVPAKVMRAQNEIRVSQQAIQSSSAISERVIAPGISDLELMDYKSKGCTILHKLSDATALNCPKGLKIKGARPDRIFHSHDLEADILINADDVWAQGIGGAGVLVAVLDTGIDTTHIELADSIQANVNFIRGPKSDRDGHGTHVSGIITGNGINEIGGNFATGSSPDATIIMGKVCGTYGCRESDILAGIEWAVAQNADIISMSLGGGNYASHCDDDPLAEKVNWAVSQGVVVIISAGNEGAGVSSPACASQAIAVGAVDKADIRATWSNYGEALDIMAPGVDILSSYSCLAAGDCGSYWYAYMSGTSMAAPNVAGVAALVLEKNPSLTPKQVKSLIEENAKDLVSDDYESDGYDIYTGHVRVDALAAVDATDTSTPTTNVPTTNVPTTNVPTTNVPTTIVPPTTIPPMDCSGCDKGRCNGRCNLRKEDVWTCADCW